MSAKPVKVLLNAAAFPFTYEYAQRTILEMQDAGPRMPGAFYGASENAEFGQPQLIYCDNVLPHAKGIFSISTGEQIAAISPATTVFDQAIQIRDTAENQYLFVPAGGLNYVLDPTTGLWTSASPFTFTNTLVTRAYVNGRTFICYEKTKIIEYNPGTGLFTTLALTLPAGVTMANIRGIGGASNYLLFFTDIAVYWCTPLNLLDFATVDQGAGQQTPIDIKGQITSLLPCSGGFIIYTARNAVGTTFTNNGNSPFVFKEVTNCGGVSSWEQVSANADDGAHYLFGTNGLQKTTLSKAETLHPEVTDFLSGNQMESWDALNKQVVLAGIGTAINVKVVFLVGRYVAISYGQTKGNYDACLFYDTVLERWGKVTVPHVDVFAYPYPTFASSYFYSQLPGLYSDLGDQTYQNLDETRLTPLPAKRGIAFLQSSGAIRIVNTDFAQTGSAGVAVFGRVQSVRQRAITILNAELDAVKAGSVTCTLLPSDEGGTERLTPVPMALAYSNGQSRRFESYETAMNFDLAIEGAFVLNNLLLRVKNHGYR